MPEKQKILFVVNPVSGGKNKTDWPQTITEFFHDRPHRTEIFLLAKHHKEDDIEAKIDSFGPDLVVAVGGDGTVSMVGKVIIRKKITMGILPAGSANGMARELGIPVNLKKALQTLIDGTAVPCDVIEIDEGKDLVFHLADLGLNALIIKYFDESRFRGMITYGRMLVKALFNKRLMKVHLKGDCIDETVSAYMIVIANASKYGTGAVINPDAVVDDGVFELVVVRKIAFSEFVKLFWSYKSFNPHKVQVIETTEVEMRSRRGVRFQIDGEYKGKVRKLSARVRKHAFRVLVPATEE